MTIPSPQDDYAERTVEIRKPEGLHMRPAMEFVDRANSFTGEVRVYKGSICVDGKSIYQIVSLAATQGTQLKITATGPDALRMVEYLAEILEKETPKQAGQAPPEHQGLCQETETQEH